MSLEQCWALNADRSRCEEPVPDGECFCEEHDTYDGLDPIDIFCLPEEQMPPDLVAYIRSRCPTWPFPQPSPPIFTLGPSAPAHAAPVAVSAAPESYGLKPADPTALKVSLAPDADAGSEEEPLAWLMARLRQAIEAVMAADEKPLQKANTVARLGGLFLRTYRAAELTKENRELRKQVVALEARLAVGDAPGTPPRAPRKTLVPTNHGDADRNLAREPASTPFELPAASPAAPAPAGGRVRGGSRASP